MLFEHMLKIYLSTFKIECVEGNGNACLTVLIVFLAELTGSDEDSKLWST